LLSLQKVSLNKIKRVDIYRNIYRDYGTYGMLTIDDEPVCLTAERPWEFNKAFVSCIPHGRYTAKREKYVSKSGSEYESYLFNNVPGRGRIFLHKGNDPIKDSEGCILLGMGLSPYNGGCHVLNSSNAFERFMKMLGDEYIQIVIHPNSFFEQKILKPTNGLRITKELISQEKELKKIKPIQKPEIKVNWIDRLQYFWHKHADDVGQMIKMVGTIIALTNPVLGGAALTVGGVLAVSEDSPLKKGEQTKGGVVWDKIINWIINILKNLFKKEAYHG